MFDVGNISTIGSRIDTTPSLYVVWCQHFRFCWIGIYCGDSGFELIDVSISDTKIQSCVGPRDYKKYADLWNFHKVAKGFVPPISFNGGINGSSRFELRKWQSRIISYKLS